MFFMSDIYFLLIHPESLYVGLVMELLIDRINNL